MQLSQSLLGLLGLAGFTLIEASPVAAPISAAECSAVNFVVQSLKAFSSATPFCSSFLHIPTSTISATSTVSQPTTAINTITGTTVTVTADAPTTTVETDSTTITTCVSSTPLAARNLPTSTHSSSASSKSSAKSTTPSVTSSHSSTLSSSYSAGIPTCVASFASAQISTACSCLSITPASTTSTTTITVTPTVTSPTTVSATTTVTPPPISVTATSTATFASCAPAQSSAPALCNNQGLQWAVYSGDVPRNTDVEYSSFDPTTYKTQTPNDNGVTNTIGGIDYPGSGQETIYGGSVPVNADYFALDHKGYIFAQETGVYTFAVSGVDDIVLLWLGSDATSGWDRADADLVVAYDDGPGVGSTTIPLVAGTYYPVRIMFGQAQGGAVFDITVTAPDGSTFLSSSSSGSPYIVQQSCDGTTAPPFPPWGQES